MYHEKPIHDWSSHACDAFRYLAIAIEELPSNTNLNKLFPKTDSEYSIHGR